MASRIHGDIKPGSILLASSGALKLSCFDHSVKVPSGEELLDFPSTGLTPQYRSPEYDVSGEKVSQKSDVWSLGCTILEFSTWYLLGHSSVQNFETIRT
ncbi:kinase-like domain-containing protein, partial [Microdochium bolleyi]